MGFTGKAALITGRDRDRGAEVVADIGGTVRFPQVDLADQRNMERLAEEVGTVDSLVNNAAGVAMGATADQELDGAPAIGIPGMAAYGATEDDPKRASN
ncbi:hypothetical protein [Streptomyces sp. NEAU-174]|uniref:hypothetical protein n=1 Tax=Streptomyces sp. NEAU-174 TaxID=3458254 RepID=UPI0040442857